MNYDKEATLVARLHKATLDEKIEWKIGTGECEVQVSFPNYSVVLSKDPNVDNYWVTIINDQGEIPEVITDGVLISDYTLSVQPPLGTWRETMRDTYRMARRKALGADKAIDDILSNLSE